ncbi:MAG: FadR/GntR family transcriptional regulator [Bacillota bacterium]
MNEFSPVRKSRVYEEIASQIKQLIIEGRFKPGDRLPPEREMAEIFRVSRNSVRDALRTLELMGLVECRHGDGTIVTCVTPETLISPLAAILATRRNLLSALMEVRKIIEPPAAQMAAQRINEDDLRELEQILASQEQKAMQGEYTIEEDNDFHYTICMAAENEVLMLMVTHIMGLLSESRARSLQTAGRVRMSVAGHRRILDAIKRRDPDLARDAMLKHLEEIENTILKNMGQENVGAG